MQANHDTAPTADVQHDDEAGTLELAAVRHGAGGDGLNAHMASARAAGLHIHAHPHTQARLFVHVRRPVTCPRGRPSQSTTRARRARRASTSSRSTVSPRHCAPSLSGPHCPPPPNRMPTHPASSPACPWRPQVSWSRPTTRTAWPSSHKRSGGGCGAAGTGTLACLLAPRPLPMLPVLPLKHMRSGKGGAGSGCR